MEREKLFEAMVGTWTGPYRVWLKPDQDKPDVDCMSSTLKVELIVANRFARADYEWDSAGPEEEAQPQAGSFLIGAPAADRWQVAWVDSWHNGHDVMFCTGADAKVAGTYGPPEEQWGWRTEFEVPSADRLVIRAYNITPTGEEALATEADYRRS